MVNQRADILRSSSRAAFKVKVTFDAGVMQDRGKFEAP